MSTRRTFLQQSSRGLGALALGSAVWPLSQTRACVAPPSRPLGVALVGLGSYSTHQLAPALQETQYCRLAGIVTGSPEKVPVWQEKYGIPDAQVYSYDTFDRIADDPAIDIVYVVLPNAMHAEYTIRAAQAGKHVICEKPMAVSVAECDAMIAACAQAGVSLSIGYRLHFDPFHQEAMRLAATGELGAVKLMEHSFGFRDMERDNWRFSKALAGGGALMDVGIYALQSTCYCSGEVPLAVTAQETKTYPARFADIDETLRWQMDFPSGAVAACTTSYAIRVHHLHTYCEEGNYEIAPAYGYGGIKGQVAGEPMPFAPVNQQALQMDGFAQHLLEGTPNRVPGEMGRRDMAIIEAIYRAVASGRREEIVY